MPEQLLNENRRDAVSQALETVRRRVDAMGVAEPNIYPKNRQIVIELPGQSDTEAELRAASTDAARRVDEILREQGAQQVTTHAVRGKPAVFKLTVPGAPVRNLIEAAFGESIVDGRLIVDDRLPAELEMVEDDAEVAADEASMMLSLSQAAQDKVLEESGEFRRLLKIIERQAVLAMHLVDDETPFRETGKPYLQALHEAKLVTQGMGISVNLEADYGRENGVTVKKPYAFRARERETLEGFFANLPAQWRLPATHTVGYGPEQIITRRGAEPEDIWRTYVLKARAEVTGQAIVNANVGFDSSSSMTSFVRIRSSTSASRVEKCVSLWDPRRASRCARPPTT
jgi:hypothetical protein